MSSNPPPQPPNPAGNPPATRAPAPRRRRARNGPAAPGPGAPAAGQPARRQIRGPHSALTDYLATHNIDATRIRRTAQDRRAAAEAALAAERAREEADAAARAAQDNEDGDVEMKDEADDDADFKDEDDEAMATRRRTRAAAKPETPVKADEKEKKRTPKQKAAETARLKALARVKASKRFQSQRKLEGTETPENSDDAAEAFLEAEDTRETQYENCEKCETRFIVTFYSRSGPNGGLLCSKCSKELDDADRASRKKRSGGRINRRNIESNRLEGKTTRGAPDLLTMSLNTLAKHIDSAEDLGELPTKLVDRLAQLLSKLRLIDPRTLDLFLNPGVRELDVYDAAKLKADDFIKIFQICPSITRLRLRNAIQFKGPVMKYLVESPVRLTSFSIHGANLLDDDMWMSFLTSKGQYLRELKVYYTDVSFGNAILAAVAEHCPDLTRLKIYHNQQVTDAGLFHIAKLTKIEHLGLHIYLPTTTAPYVEIIKSVGPNLRTLSLSNIDNLDDSVLSTIHKNCTHLTKLRLKKNEHFTDSAFTSLFKHWANRPLEFVDLGECRHLDSQMPVENPSNIGLCDGGFRALMSHSRETLRYLNILSCRHISNETFIEVFNIKGTPFIKRSQFGEMDIEAVPGHVYPKLETLDLSFCQGVDDVVVQMIWQSCPRIKNLKVFGNFGVKHVKVPRGRILLGAPSLMGLEYEGEEDSE